ncbi:MAG: UpxY family transcription antiterminator [Bacteroidales bacterium]|nr:UpxY family transcription antiterminator [Bacteroidales bacterium]
MDQNQKNWFAIYTKSRNEKKVYDRLIEAGVEVFLPLLKVLKQWSDRKKWVEEPLFRSYIFVRIQPQEYYQILNIPGVVRYIAFEGKAVPVPPQQILAIKQFLNNEEDIREAGEEFEIGDRVEIFRGTLKGLLGDLIDIRGKQKVRIEIENIGHSIILTIPKSYLRMIRK